MKLKRKHIHVSIENICNIFHTIHLFWDLVDSLGASLTKIKTEQK